MNAIHDLCDFVKKLIIFSWSGLNENHNEKLRAINFLCKFLSLIFNFIFKQIFLFSNSNIKHFQQIQLF